MKKTAFKTFVCSFVFSLFILFTINGLFFYTPEATSQNVKIPSKNISLFFMGDAGGAVSAKVRPIKKIALSLPPQKKPAQATETVYAPAKLPTPSAEPAVQKAPKIQDKPAFDDIPLEIAAADIADMPAEPASQSGKEFVSADFDRIMNTPPPVYDGEKTKKETAVSVGKQLAAADVTAPAKEAPKKRVISITDPENEKDQGGWDAGDEDYSVDENELHAPKPLLIASGETREPARKAINPIAESNDEGGYDKGSDNYDIEENDQNLLIPLQKDFAAAEGSFKVARTADKDQIAMVSGNTPISSMINKDNAADGIVRREPKAEEQQPGKNWESMAEKSGSDNPWVAAKGTKFPKNNAVLDAKYYKDADQAALEAPQGTAEDGKSVKLAADMVQNILIPIPEDILNEKNLVPQLESSKDDKNKTDDQQEAANQIKKELSKEDSVSMPTESPKKESKGGLLKSITSLFSGGGSTEDNGKETAEEDGGNSFVDRITGRVGRHKDGNKPTKILPAEMRLAFQPNRAEISGTTLKWIQAFANKVNSDRSVILEIRIDGTSSYALQQKRLNLLHNILTNKGVDYRKINTVFTTREPNSFIIRTVRINSNIDRDVKESKDQAAYYQSW